MCHQQLVKYLTLHKFDGKQKSTHPQIQLNSVDNFQTFLGKDMEISIKERIHRENK